LSQGTGLFTFINKQVWIIDLSNGIQMCVIRAKHL